MKNKIITFGEIMLRLSPENNERFTQCHEFEAVYGGGEANTAVSLANFGVDCGFCNKNFLNIQLDRVLSIPFVSMELISVALYAAATRLVSISLKKRQASALLMLFITEVVLLLLSLRNLILTGIRFFKDATWFHFSGITPAISDNMAKITLAACKAAKEKGLTISCDLNYRSKLWSSEKANKVMSELCPYVDICIANEDDAVGIFSMDASKSDKKKMHTLPKNLQNVFHLKWLLLYGVQKLLSQHLSSSL